MSCARWWTVFDTERVITAKILLHRVQHVRLRLLAELGCGKAPQNNHNWCSNYPFRLMRGVDQKGAILQSWENFSVRGLVKFVPAVAYHFCLSLSGTFSQPCTNKFSRLCMESVSFPWRHSPGVLPGKLLGLLFSWPNKLLGLDG